MKTPSPLEISTAATVTCKHAGYGHFKHHSDVDVATPPNSPTTPTTPAIQSPVPAAVADILIEAQLVYIRRLGYIAAAYGAPIKVLGKGTGGIVHLYKVPATGQLVAIKTFAFPAGSLLRRRLQHVEGEAAVALAMQHPNIVRTHEFVFELNADETDGTFYAVMEYCAVDLFELVHGRKLSMRVIESLLIQLVAGVQYLHRVHSMAHRDLKLDNVVVTTEGTLKIIDFGCTRVVPVNPLGFALTTGVCGSDPYLPPEVLADPNVPYDAMRLDVWSIAVVFVAMVTGNFPWEVARPNDPNFQLYLEYGPRLVDHWLPSVKGFAPAARMIKRMLHLNAAKRPTIDGVISDPYFQSLLASHSG
ncbi:kinase-like protein [Ramicandelaber brevisporus]|nr:kinase-like protein [Ramicandelaber brevisporus]